MAVYKPGSKGEEVKRIQERLKILDYYKGPIDGDFGRGTEAAVKMFQKDKGLTVVFNPKYWACHLGLKGTNGAVDKRSIGIELASEGGLIQRDGKLYCFDTVSDRTLFTQEYYDHGNEGLLVYNRATKTMPIHRY